MKKIYMLILLSICAYGAVQAQVSIDSLDVETDMWFHPLPVNSFDSTYYFDVSITGFDSTTTLFHLITLPENSTDSLVHIINIQAIEQSPGVHNYLSQDTLNYRVDSLQYYRLRAILHEPTSNELRTIFDNSQ